MKNSKIVLSEDGTERHLPADLWPEILSMLPVKSLMRFRCVSKSWLSLIGDPDFCRLHPRNFKNNSDETHLLVTEGDQRNCVLRCSSDDTFQGNAELLHTLEPGWYIRHSIDGLVLLKGIIISEISRPCKLRMWNPSIRKFHEIPPLPELKEHDIGLGYDPLVKDYKYVQIVSKVTDEILPQVAVYTLGARSWKIVPFQFQGGGPNWHSMENLRIMTTVYFQGSLYFIVYDKRRRVLELVSMDLSNEVFSYTSLPGCGCYSKSLSGPLTVVDDGGKLALFDSQCGTMWVLECGFWSRRYSFGFNLTDDFAFIYHKKNGEILRWGELKAATTITLSEEDEMVQWDILSSYNLETKRQKILLQKEYLNDDIGKVCGYIDSSRA